MVIFFQTFRLIIKYYDVSRALVRLSCTTTMKAIFSDLATICCGELSVLVETSVQKETAEANFLVKSQIRNRFKNK